MSSDLDGSPSRGIPYCVGMGQAARVQDERAADGAEGRAAGRPRPCIMVVGPTGGEGGIATVIGTLLESTLAIRFDLVHVATHSGAAPHSGAGRIGKGLYFLDGFAHAVVGLATRRVDLVYLHTSSGYSMRRKAAVAMLARLARKPYVVHVHGSNFDEYYTQSAAWERRLVRRTLSRAPL